jgi:hypothetical protein
VVFHYTATTRGEPFNLGAVGFVNGPYQLALAFCCRLKKQASCVRCCPSKVLRSCKYHEPRPAEDEHEGGTQRFYAESCVRQVQQKGDQVRVEKRVRLVHKRPAGRGCGSRSPQGHSSGAGAKPEQPVCEQAVAFSLRRPPRVGVVFFVGEAFPCSSNEDPLSNLRGFRPPELGSGAGSSPDWERFG